MFNHMKKIAVMFLLPIFVVLAGISADFASAASLEGRYPPSVLQSLTRTEIFLPSAIRHILMGNVRNDAFGGCHYAGIKYEQRKILPNTKKILNDYGVYRAKVMLGGKLKKGNGGYSTFFPDKMTPQEIIDAINEAYDNRVFVPGSGNVYNGFSKGGIEIQMYLTKDDKVISAFPWV